MQYNGFKCDLCGKVIDPKDRTKVTKRFEGSINGEYCQDVCPECVALPEGVTLKPLRRRKPRKRPDEAA